MLCVRMVAVVATLAAGCQASKSGSNSPDPEGDGSSGGAASSEAGAPVSGGPTSDDATLGGSDASGDPMGGESSGSGEPPPPPNLTPGCGTAPSGDVLDGVITIRDEARSYLIEVPADYDPNVPYPIVFGFHGDGGDSSNARNGYRLSEWYEGQAIVVYPDGSGAGGSPAWDTAAGGADVEMVMAIAQEVGLEMCFDLNRVHAFGYSRGGAMAHAVGCYRGDFFTGIGASSGWAPSTGLCQQPIAVFMSHGLSDDRVPFSSGRNSRDAWASYNGCSENTTMLSESGCIAFEGCDGRAPVHWCEFDGGHTFDGDYAGQAVALFQTL